MRRDRKGGNYRPQKLGASARASVAEISAGDQAANEQVAAAQISVLARRSAAAWNFMLRGAGVFWSHRAEQGAPTTRIASTEADAATPIEKPKDPVVTGAITPGNIEQPPLTGDDASPTEVTPPTEATPQTEVIPPAAEAPTPADPIIAAILSKLQDSSTRSRAQSEDLAALESFYAKHNDAAVWMSDAGFSAKAKAIIGEIENAADLGPSPGRFRSSRSGRRAGNARGEGCGRGQT